MYQNTHSTSFRCTIYCFDDSIQINCTSLINLNIFFRNYAKFQLQNALTLIKPIIIIIIIKRQFIRHSNVASHYKGAVQESSIDNLPHPGENLLQRVYFTDFSIFFDYCYSFRLFVLFYIVCVTDCAVNVL